MLRKYFKLSFEAKQKLQWEIYILNAAKLRESIENA